VLITLVLTMRAAFSLRNFKISMLLLVVTVSLSLAWSYLAHLWFYVIVACAVSAALAVMAGRNTWRQTGLADPAPPRIKTRRGCRQRPERPQRAGTGPAPARAPAGRGSGGEPEPR
jgi:hypothetical protein